MLSKPVLDQRATGSQSGFNKWGIHLGAGNHYTMGVNNGYDWDMTADRGLVFRTVWHLGLVQMHLRTAGCHSSFHYCDDFCCDRGGGRDMEQGLRRISGDVAALCALSWCWGPSAPMATVAYPEARRVP